MQKNKTEKMQNCMFMFFHDTLRCKFNKECSIKFTVRWHNWLNGVCMQHAGTQPHIYIVTRNKKILSLSMLCDIKECLRMWLWWPGTIWRGFWSAWIFSKTATAVHLPNSWALGQQVSGPASLMRIRWSKTRASDLGIRPRRRARQKCLYFFALGTSFPRA